MSVAALALATVSVAVPAASAADDTAPAGVRNMKVSTDTSRVKLDWSSNRESDLAGYLVYRAASADGPYTRLTGTPRTSSDYSDTAAPVGTPTYYQVTAVDDAGNESAPVAVTGTRKDRVKPAAPTGATVTGSGSTYTVDWADNGDADLAGYVVSRATSAGGRYARLTATPVPASVFTDTTVPSGVTPHYRITAVDHSGNASGATTVTLPDEAAPAAVTGVKVSADSSRVKLDWSSNRESDLAGYHVYRATSPDGDHVRLTTTPRTSSDYSDSAAPVGVPAYYRVTAVDRSGNESAAVSASGARRDTVKPTAPTGARVSGSAGSYTVDWTDNSEADLAGYHVYRASSSGGSYTRLTSAPVAESSYTDTAVPAGVTPYYRIVAVDHSANASAATTVTVPDEAAPVAVSGMTVSADSSRVKLDWTSNRESDLAGYHVYRATSPDGDFVRLTTTPVTSSEYSDRTGTPGTVTHYRVTAVDRTGNESPAVSATGVRRDTIAPARPTELVATAGADGVILTWAAGTDADLAGYVVSRAATSGGTYAQLTASPVVGSSFVDATAPAGSTSYYRVTAVDTSNNASTAASISVDVADTVAPATPAGLSAEGTAEGIRLTWTPGTDDDLAGYRVLRSATETGEYEPMTSAPVTGASFLDADVSAASSWFYRVVAVDLSGNESAAVTVQGIPADTVAPAAPASLQVTGSASDVTLDWADNAEADLAGYLISRSDQESGQFTALTTEPISASEFVDDTATAGVTSYYRVVAVDGARNASAPATGQAARVVAKTPVAGAAVTVAQDGSGDHTTVAAALAAAPADATTPFVIGIKPGTYRETLTVDKPNVVLLGATTNAQDVVITYDNAAGTPKPDGTGTYGTSGSATVLIKANNVTTRNLTIENAYRETGTGSEQAVALKTVGDRLVFDNVRLLGDQDTLYADSPRAGALARSYYVNSYVEGDVDFVFGRGTVVFDRSTLHAATRGSASNNGYVTAPSTDKSLPYGYLITDSRITSDAPAGTFHLGRPWQPSGDVNAVAQVVVRDTELSAAIKAAPWTDMGASAWLNARFSEYRNTGAGAAVNGDRPQLTDGEAVRFTKFAYLAGADGWNPTGETPPADTAAPVTPSGLTGEPGDSSVALTWTANADEDLAGYNVYRSTTAEVAITDGNKVSRTLLTAPAYTDRTAANGTAYRYVVTAVDKAGNESSASGAVAATPIGVPLPAHDILVAQDGTGQHTSVQAALDAAPAGTAAKPTVIAVKPGVYREMLSLSKSYVTVIGTTGNATDVVLTYDNAAGTTNPLTGTTYGTGASQSVLVKGNNVTVRDLTIENSFDEAAFTYSGEQAVALKTTGDRLVFDNVRLLGNQDTLLVDSPDAPVVARSYFVNSYIEGDVDFIFGRGTAVFDRTTIHALTRGSSSNNGYITAASTSDKNPFGFLIIDSTITSNAPAGTYSLGRPWRGWSDGYTKNGVVYNSRGQVTIRNTELPAAIRAAQPWADMSPNLWTDGRFSEYQNTGAGSTVNANRPQLSDADAAAKATPQAYLAGSDGWNPSGR